VNTAPVYRIQAISSIADGIALTTVVLYFSHVVGLPAGSIGLVLSVSAAAALVSATPLGLLADRVGLRATAVGYSVAIAAAFAAYTVAHSLWAYACAAVVFGVARAGIAATTQAIVAAQLPPDQRVPARARLQALLNAGFGIGSVAGAAALAAGRAELFVALYAGCVAALALCAAMFGRLRVTSPARSAGPRPTRRAGLRDGRLLRVTALTAVLQLTMPILSVLLPLWLATQTKAPTWAAAVAFGLNTLLSYTTQRRWARRIRTNADARRSTLVAGAALATACLLFAVTGAVGSLAATVLALAGVVALTAGEVATGPATWHLALRDTPADRQGEYQAIFGMSSSLARILGPLAALPLLTALGPAGWTLLAATLLTASTTLALTSRPTPKPAPPTTRARVPEIQKSLAGRV
jgi:MFS family permease